MSTKLPCSEVPTMEICPNCRSEMTITEVTPIFLADGFEDVTYRCKGCRSNMKRTFKRRSGAWELVTLPSFLDKKENSEAKSRAWLEAECLKLARRTLGGSEIQLATIRRLHPKGMGPNWKVADIIPQPTPLVSGEVRAAAPVQSR